jgi:acyl dehydratase
MNHHPLHINDLYAGQSQQGQNVVVGPLVYALALGMSVSDVSGKAIANLATEELSHPAPVFTATRCSASRRCSRCAPPSRSRTAA